MKYLLQVLTRGSSRCKYMRYISFYTRNCMYFMYLHLLLPLVSTWCKYFIYLHLVLLLVVPDVSTSCTYILYLKNWGLQLSLWFRSILKNFCIWNQLFPKYSVECTSRIKANISSFLVITWHLYRKSHKTIWNVYVSNLHHSDKAAAEGNS